MYGEARRLLADVDEQLGLRRDEHDVQLHLTRFRPGVVRQGHGHVGVVPAPRPARPARRCPYNAVGLVLQGHGHGIRLVWINTVELYWCFVVLREQHARAGQLRTVDERPRADEGPSHRNAQIGSAIIRSRADERVARAFSFDGYRAVGHFSNAFRAKLDRAEMDRSIRKLAAVRVDDRHGHINKIAFLLLNAFGRGDADLDLERIVSLKRVPVAVPESQAALLDVMCTAR